MHVQNFKKIEIKKICFPTVCFGIFLYLISLACNKGGSGGYYNCTGTSPAADSPALLQFAKNNGIVPLKDSTGLYYQIINQGSGPFPSATSKIYVTYTGELMNGAIFDSTSNSSSTGFQLNQLIKGWQIGLPKIQTGGQIKLLIPSALAYGCTGAGTKIPPNAPVYFEIKLVFFQ